MSHGSGGIQIVAVINPCLYSIIYTGCHGKTFAGLYGVAPPELKVTPKIPTRQLVTILDQWRNYNPHINELISSSERIEFEQSCLVDGIAFGKLIFFQKSGQTINLKDYLLQTTIGVSSEDPFRDALIIKDNSLKPEDFNSSLSSSDDSISSLVKDRRKFRGRASGLQKPVPLPEGKSPDLSRGFHREYSISQEDSSVVSAIIKNQTLPSGFYHRFSSVPRRDIFSSNQGHRSTNIKNPVEKKQSDVKEVKLDELFTVGETEIGDDFARRKEEWIEDLAAKHAFVKVERPVKLKEIEMSSEVNPSPIAGSMGRGKYLEQLALTHSPVTQGRGHLLRTIMEQENDDNPSRSSSGMGRGQYLNLPVTSSPKVGGRGQWLRKVFEQTSLDSSPRPGALRRVFSLDVFGGAFRATTIADDDSTSESANDSSAMVFRDNTDITTDLPTSSTSTESLNQSSENQAQMMSTNSHLEERNTSDADTTQGSALSLKIDKSQMFIPEEIPSDCLLNDYMKRLIAFGGLIHGKNPVHPKTNFSEMDIHPLIIETLEKKSVKDLQRSQSYSIPAILSRRNTVIISPPKSGKTLAAIIPLLSLLCEREFYSSLKEGSGPRAVYITSYARSVRYVEQFITLIAPHLSVVSTYGGGLELERKEALVNGCDIVVSTPRCWLRLLTYKWVTNVNRLCHLCIDDLDTVINLFTPELMEIFKVFEGVKVKRKEAGPEPQMVLVGESWTPSVEDIVFRRLMEPLLCMTSHLEAALYAHIKPRIHILNPNSKIDKLKELLRDKNEVPCIIICNDSDEVTTLRNLFYTQRSKIVSAHENMSLPLLRDAHINWQNMVKSKDSPPLMIVSDEILCDMGIYNAQWLCHYSLPVSKTNFSYRFSTIKANFIDRLINPQASAPNCKIDILVDYTNEDQLPDVVSFMSRLKTQIPEELLIAVEKINKKKETSKISEVGLCESLLQFGRCLKGLRCKQQHCINYTRDKPRSLPLCGHVKVKVLKVHSASHYSVRLIAHTEHVRITPDCWTEIQSSYVALSLHMNRFYANRNNRRMHGTPQIGDFAAVEEEPDITYKRVKVLQIIRYDERHTPVNVKVHYIDEGTVADIKVLSLFYLPDELQAYSQTSVDLYLTGLLPVDLDKDWSGTTIFNVRKTISSIPEDYIFIAKIALVIGNSMLVENLKAIEMLEISKCSVVHLSLKNYLLENNLAVKNPDHLNPLIQLCQEANLPVSAVIHQGDSLKVPKKSLISKKAVTDSLSQVTWAHLPKDEISTVILTSAESPSLFYVCHEKFSPLLTKLEKDIADYMENNVNLINITEISPYLICCAKYEDRWNRGLLCEEPPESGSEQDELRYPVLFVDYGDIAYLPSSDIAHCPDKFISLLPFQGIKCELVGLNPINNEWSEDVADTLYDMTQITDDEGIRTFKNMSLIVTGIVADASYNKFGKHYKVILIDSSSGEDVVVNKEIVYKGFANWNPLEKHLLDTVNTANFQQEILKEDDSISDSIFSEVKGEDNTTSDASSTLNSQQGSWSDSEISAGVTDDNELIDMLEKFDIQIPSDSGNSPLTFFASLQRKVLSLAGRTPHVETFKDTKKFSKTSHRSGAASESENDADVSELEDSCITYKTSVDYHLKSGFFTPKTGWLQTESYIYVRIMLPGVEKYSLMWSSRHFDFSASYDGNMYRLYVDFFGPIASEKLSHSARGQYVEIKMLKVLTDFKWPRLLYDEREKPIWLQILNEPDLKDEDSLNAQIDLGEISSKYYKKKSCKIDEEILPYDKDDDDESDGSDVFDNEINHDPYDPLC